MITLRGASILSRRDHEEISSWVLYLGSLAPPMFLMGWLSLQWFDPLILEFYDLGGWISWFTASVCVVSIIASLNLHNIEVRRLKLISVTFCASWLSIMQLVVFVLFDPKPYPSLILFKGPKGPLGIYLVFLGIMSMSSIIASALIIRHMKNPIVAPYTKHAVGKAPNGYAIGFPLVLSALVLVSASLMLLDDLPGLSSNIARFILIGTFLPALVYLVGSLVMWRNLGTIYRVPDE